MKHPTTLRTYDELIRVRDAFMKASQQPDGPGRWGFVVLIGGTGLAKSTILDAALQQLYPPFLEPNGHKRKQYKLIKGVESPIGFYIDLATHLDMPILCDDVDEALCNPTFVSILASAGETNSKVKYVQYGKLVKQLIDAGIPRTIETKSPLMVILNSLPTGLALRRSEKVLSRAMLFEFKPDAREVHRFVGTFLPCENIDPDVYEYIGQNLQLIIEPDIRADYEDATAMKQQGWGDWKEYLNHRWRKDPDRSAWIEIYNDPTIQTDADRKAVWMDRTGGSQAKWYRVTEECELLLGIRKAGEKKKYARPSANEKSRNLRVRSVARKAAH